MKIIAAAVMCICIALASSVAENQIERNSERLEQMPNQGALDKTFSSGSYELARGNRFNITLESNRTTGYQWRLIHPMDQKVIKLIGTEYQSPQVKLPGAGGKEVWTFEAVAPGKTEIAMHYERRWEKGIPPARTAKFAVTVK